jgi:integration host factor subunit beta
MTKSDLIDVLCETRKMPKGRAELLVNAIFDSMEATLRRGERIEIRGFGSFEIRNYRSYEGRNPRTGATVNVKPKRLPFFKVGKELKERVNDAVAGNGVSRPPTPVTPPPTSGPSGANGSSEPKSELAPATNGTVSSSAPVDSPSTTRSATA